MLNPKLSMCRTNLLQAQQRKSIRERTGEHKTAGGFYEVRECSSSDWTDWREIGAHMGNSVEILKVPCLSSRPLDRGYTRTVFFKEPKNKHQKDQDDPKVI